MFLAEKGISVPLVSVDLAGGAARRCLSRDQFAPRGEVMAIWRYLEAHHLKELERAGLIDGKFMNVLLRRDVSRA